MRHERDGIRDKMMRRTLACTWTTKFLPNTKIGGGSVCLYMHMSCSQSTCRLLANNAFDQSVRVRVRVTIIPSQFRPPKHQRHVSFGH